MTDRSQQLQRQVLERMLEIAGSLSASPSLREILAVIINAMRDTLDAERATVLEYDPETHELFSTVAHGLARFDPEVASPEGAEGDVAARAIRIPADSGIAGQCATTRAIVNVPDAYADERFNPAVDRRTGFRTRSILTVPLLDPDGTLIGVAQVLNKRGRPFDEHDERIATALASLAAVAIRRGRLIEDRLARQKLERELEVAREIQQQTFPRRLPVLPGIDLDAWSEPADATGGDTVDVVAVGVPRGDGVADAAIAADRALLLLGDAAGHGVGPALNAAQIRAMLRMAVRLAGDEGPPLMRLVAEINEQLCADLPAGRFITAWVGLIDGPTRTVTYASAGQGPIFHYDARRATVDLLSAHMVPFGVLPGLDVPEPDRLTLAPGDVLCVPTDGVLEAPDASGEQFGKHRVAELLKRCADASAREISAALRRAVDEFAGPRAAGDDRSAVVVKVTR